MIRLLIALSAVAFFLGCSSAEDNAAGLSNDLCAEMTCEAGFTCQFGICVEDQVVETRLSIALLIAPPSFREDLSELHVSRLPVTLGESLPAYGLQPPATVEGVVLFNATEQDVATPVAGDVRFRSQSGLPGFEFEASTRIDAGGQYSIQVPLGTYDVSVIPARPDLSRSIARGVTVGSASEFKPFNVLAPEQYDIISGVVERNSGTVGPVAGARVFAVSEGGEHETTVDVTDESGQFIVFAPPSDNPYEFHVRPTEDSEWVPSAVFEPVAPELGTDLRLWVGDFPELVPIDVTVATTDGAPVQDVAVSVRSEIEPGAGSPALVSAYYSTLILSDDVDEDGGFTVNLPPVRTEFYAAPLSTELGPAQPVIMAIDEDGGELELVVEQRHLIEGFVSGASGNNPVNGVSVVASWVASDTQPLSRYPLPQSVFAAATTSGEDGRFSFRVPPGNWTVEFAPPLDAGFGYAREVVGVGRESVNGFNAQLPDSGAVQGRVQDSEGAPLAGASIQAFSLEDGEAILIGEASTDADGLYRLVLAIDAAEAPSSGPR